MPLEATRRWQERHFHDIIKSHAHQVGGSQIRKKKKKLYHRGSPTSGIRRRNSRSICLWSPVGLECRSAGLEETDFTLAGGIQGFLYTGAQHKAGTPQELETHCDSRRGRKRSSSGRSPREHRQAWALLTVTVLASRPGPTQVGVSGQTTGRTGTQPHPSADRVPQATLSSQPPISTPLNVASPTRGTRPSSSHQWAGSNPSHQEACTSPGPTSPTTVGKH